MDPCLHALTVIALLITILPPPVAADEVDWITVKPEKTEAILCNPGVGWQTFHRTATNDSQLPDWIPSTVRYERFGWQELEPTPSKIDEPLLKTFLQQSKVAGQKAALRVMCCSSTPGQPYHPLWLEQAGGKVINTRHGLSRKLPIPDLDDPVTLAAHLDFIRRLGALLDGHESVDHIDIGSVGWWGEWHMSDASHATMPTKENQRKIVDAYLAAFPRTPLLMLVNGGELLTYATEQGAGWRADSLGDMGPFWKNWSHMRNGYPQWLTEGKALDAWQHAPVAFETGGDMRSWALLRFDFRYIFNYALALHASQVNNKSAPLPHGEKHQQEIRRFLQRLGYRLELLELRHPRQIEIGTRLPLTMRWQNTGSAPCYRPYQLAYRLTDDAGNEHILPSTITVERWMPGSVKPFTEAFLESPPELPLGKVLDVADELLIPQGLPPGPYQLSLGITDPATHKPVVQLGILGRDAQGWYPLSKIVCR